MPRIVSTYIFREMLTPFLISVGVLTATGILSKFVKLIELIVNYGVGPWMLLLFVLSLLPSFLIYIIPLSFLIAVLFTFTRLSSDCELIAMKASGLSLLRISRPVFVMAIIVYIVSTFFTLYVFPWGTRLNKKVMFDTLRTKTIVGLKEQSFVNTFEGLTIYIDRILPEDGTIHGIFISDARNGEEPTIIFANSGTFIADPDTVAVTLRLFNGSIHSSPKDTDKYHLVSFNRYDFNVHMRDRLQADDPSQRTNRELFLKELMARIEEKESSGEDPAPFIIDLHKRFALPAAVFVLAIIGIPLGIHRVRATRHTSFGIAILVSLIYYLLSTVMESLGEGGRINPIVAVWGSDIVMGLAGIYIFLKEEKSGSFGIRGWLSRLSRNSGGSGSKAT